MKRLPCAGVFCLRRFILKELTIIDVNIYDDIYSE
jgi:hypothetical protein